MNDVAAAEVVTVSWAVVVAGMDGDMPGVVDFVLEFNPCVDGDSEVVEASGCCDVASLSVAVASGVGVGVGSLLGDVDFASAFTVVVDGVSGVVEASGCCEFASPPIAVAGDVGVSVGFDGMRDYFCIMFCTFFEHQLCIDAVKFGGWILASCSMVF